MINIEQANFENSEEYLLSFETAPSLEAKIIFLIGHMYRSGQISAEQRTVLKQALFEGNEQILQSC